MSEPVQGVVSYPPPPFLTVAVQLPDSFPVTLPEAPAPEVQTPDPVSVSVELVNGSPAVVVVMLGGGATAGADGEDGEDGDPGPAGTSVTPVVLTLAAYLALTAPQQTDATKFYVIPKTS